MHELQDIDSKTIQLLEGSGYQTIAELSVCTLEDLTAIDGMSEENASSVLEQAKLYMEKHENS